MSPTSVEHIRSILKVYFIMGSPNCLNDPIEVLKEAIDGGITLYQFREKGTGALTGAEKLKLAMELQHLCRTRNIPFIVNDDMEFAAAINADGVHIGQDDAPAKTVRKMLGSNKIMGVSVHTVEEALQAIEDGADYLGVGPVFPTFTKLDAKEVQGTRLIQELRSQGIKLPIVGIGGITPENAGMVLAAGADGVSIISAITHAPSIRNAAAQFVQKSYFI